jgi:F-type H+-transporting ATPase subunit delta
MFRGVTRKLLAATLPQGHSYLSEDMKVTDLDPSAQNPTLSTMALTLTRQESAIFKQDPVKSVQINTTSGYLGITPGHEYKISKLLPGAIKVEVTEGNFKTYFASGGFAHMNNIGTVDINCVECLPLEYFDLATAEKELLTATEMERNGKDEAEKAVGLIKVQTLEALIAALKE